MKKIFVISDVHGGYSEMIKCLNKAGFDENNEEHLLISCGDMFDRLSESLLVYKYLKKLNDKGKAICLKGNHEPMFIDYLKHNTNPFNYFKNGTRATMASFLEIENPFPFELWCEKEEIETPTHSDFAYWVEDAKIRIKQKYPELLGWLENLPYYFETENYIFTHAAIDTNAEDWHFPKCSTYNFEGWEALTWDDGTFITKKILNTNKTVVVGHFDTGELRNMWQIDTKDKYDSSILYQKREDGSIEKIFIDGCVVCTKNVNVLVLEDELC